MAIKVVAERHPPGDRWVLTEDTLEGRESVVHPSLTAALNEIYMTTGDKVFTVDAAKGTITVDEEIQQGPRQWDLYGEHGKDLLQG